VVSAARVLVVDDDATVTDVLVRYLVREGFTAEAVGDGPSALTIACDRPPDLVLLDLMLPGMDGLEVCRRLRTIGPIPVIMLTAKGDEADRVVGLELGADDYVAKPFSPREVTARVKAVLRRAQGLHAGGASPVDEILRSEDGELVLDPSAHQASLGGAPLMLTAREFELLAWLMAHPHRVFRREELLEQVWGYTYGDTSTVTVHVRRLREKIESVPSSPTRIVTVWGVGYRYEQ
jgi:DNA-binding response OmpR family regulator